MRQRFRRLPPPLWALGLLALLFPLATLAVGAWALFRNHWGLSATRAQALAPAFVLLSFACNWPVTAYNARFRHPARVIPWLDAWRGQLAAVLGLAALPLGSLAVGLFIPPTSPLYSLEYLLGILALLVLLAAFAWALLPPPPRRKGDGSRPLPTEDRMNRRALVILLWTFAGINGLAAVALGLLVPMPHPSVVVQLFCDEQSCLVCDQQGCHELTRANVIHTLAPLGATAFAVLGLTCVILAIAATRTTQSRAPMSYQPPVYYGPSYAPPYGPPYGQPPYAPPYPGPQVPGNQPSPPPGTVS